MSEIPELIARYGLVRKQQQLSQAQVDRFIAAEHKELDALFAVMEQYHMITTELAKQTIPNRDRKKSQAELACLAEEEHEYHELCHSKVQYQFSGQAAADYRDRLAASHERSTCT